jgi:hypothetical protein
VRLSKMCRSVYLMEEDGDLVMENDGKVGWFWWLGWFRWWCFLSHSQLPKLVQLTPSSLVFVMHVFIVDRGV